MSARLVVAAASIGLLLASGFAAAQQVNRQLYLTYDPDRATCLLPDVSRAESRRCYVMECGVAGDHCICPLKLPNDWKQPLTEDQCRKLNAMLRPLPPKGAERLGPDGGVVPPIPGDCTAEQHRALQDAVDAACKGPARKCIETQDCATLRRNHDQNVVCVRARETINTTCFRGGDFVHRVKLDDERRAVANCARLIDEKKCR
ncbi:MAG TPA: hypothetical protein VFA20_03895 [Myxococcaceae bacterium]|nr:hypothetical protein [Myxococcaceae bacterium]